MREVRFSEVDLSEPTAQGGTWENIGMTVERIIDLSQFANQHISTKEEAKSIANTVLENEQQNGRYLSFELMIIEHDLNKNIWIFIYFQDPLLYGPGSDFSVAVDGNNIEILRMWV